MNNCPTCNQRIPDNIAIRVRVLRYQKGWSMAQLAKITGLDRSTIFKIERSERIPRPETIKLLKEAFGVKAL